MLWIILSLTAYFIMASVEIADKKILSSPKLGALTYAFYAGLLTIFILFFWPLDFAFLSLRITIVALISGIAFFAGFFFLYRAIIEGEVSRVISLVGGLSPIIIFFFSVLFLEERPSTHIIIALLMLITGSLLLSFVGDGNKLKLGTHFFLMSFLASFFFAISYGLTKVVYLNASFLNGLIWVRVGTLLCSLLVLISPKLRRHIFEGSKGFSQKLTALFVTNKVLSSVAQLGLNYAIKIGSVAVINALQAVEYAFIFVITLGLSCFYPHIFYESTAPKNLISKIMGITFICFGVALLFFNA